jgi:hypothetical protein
MPVVRQLSIFLANKPGVLGRLCRTFAENEINIQAISVSDTVDHAVVRLVTSNPAKARGLLEDAGVLVVDTDVLALSLPDKPGALATLAQKLAKAKINIEYSYGTTGGKDGVFIMRVSDIKRAKKLLKMK